MSDISVLVAQAVVAELQAGVDAGDVFALTFKPRRMYDTTVQLEDQLLHVDVFSGDMESEADTRSSYVNKVNVDVAVRQQVDKSDVAKCDALMALRDQVKEYLGPFSSRGACPLSTYPDAQWSSVITRATFYPAELRGGQFTAILTFTYMVWQ